MIMRRTAGAFAALAMGLGGAVAIAQPASASGGCGGSLIWINWGTGAEPPRQAYGHEHVTGNHYIRRITNYPTFRLVQWWADNNGGSDGDTADTLYTETVCA
jgi:hypothetical protein